MSQENPPNFVFKRNDWMTKCLPNLLESRKCGSFCDVILKVGEKIIPAHRIILSTTIPFFEAMFRNDFREGNEKIEMEGIDADVLESLVNLSYGAEIEINNENADLLLFGADFLQLNDLKKEYVGLLKAHLNADNVMRTKHAGENLDCVELVKAAQQFIDNSFLEFSCSNDFLELESQELISIIERDELGAPEEKVYEAVLKWIKHAPFDRASLLPEILFNVRLSLMSPSFLYNIVRNEILVKSSHECRDLLDEAMAHMIPGITELPKSFRHLPRNGTEIYGLIYILGGEFNSKIQVYDPRENKCTYVQNLQKNEHLCAAAVYEGKFYTFGGFSKGHSSISYSPKVEVFDFKANTVTPLRSLDSAKSEFAAAVLGELIYVCGGYNGSRLNVVQSYSPKTDTFTTLSPLNQARCGHKAVSLNDEIYVIGGWSKAYLNSCEKYDPETNAWSTIKPMTTARHHPGVAVLQNKIYVCGGESDRKKKLNTTEVYDPLKDEWTSASPMNSKRSHFALVSINNKFYAIGGLDGSNTLSSVEVYDPVTNSWSFVAPLLTATNDMCYGFIPN